MQTTRSRDALMSTGDRTTVEIWSICDVKLYQKWDMTIVDIFSKLSIDYWNASLFSHHVLIIFLTTVSTTSRRCNKYIGFIDDANKLFFRAILPKSSRDSYNDPCDAQEAFKFVARGISRIMSRADFRCFRQFCAVIARSDKADAWLDIIL